MRLITALFVGLACTGAAAAQGMLVPTDKSMTPLSLVAQDVRVVIEEQAAETHVVQTFRNHTSRPVEADFVFPVPKGASVKQFTMWVDGKEVKSELIDADKARTIYTPQQFTAAGPGVCGQTNHGVEKRLSRRIVDLLQQFVDFRATENEAVPKFANLTGGETAPGDLPLDLRFCLERTFLVFGNFSPRFGKMPFNFPAKVRGRGAAVRIASERRNIARSAPAGTSIRPRSTRRGFSSSRAKAASASFVSLFLTSS